MLGKIIAFEGMGYAKAEGCNDVGNCRLRSAFETKNGRRVYLEILRTIPTTEQAKYRGDLVAGKSYIYCDFAHYITDEVDDKGYNVYDDTVNRIDSFDKKVLPMEWTRENILQIVRQLGGLFDNVVVYNKGQYRAFRTHQSNRGGNAQNYIYNA